MRHNSPLVPVLLALVASATSLSAQSVRDRVAAADGSIRMSFSTRAGVCGDGSFIGEDTPDGFRMYRIWDQGFSISAYEDWQPSCTEGPLRLRLDKSGNRIRDLRAAVGVSWRGNEDAIDLGTVPAREAANWLLDLAPELDNDDARVAFLAAAMSDGAPIAERFMSIARNKDLRPGLREGTMRWLVGAARLEGLSAQADRTLRGIASDENDHVDVRERAVRSLSETALNDAFLRDLYATAGRTEVQERILRRLAESRTDETVGWMEQVALDSRSRLPLRERALRVLGDEMRHPDRVQRLYPRLDHVALKERALRVIAEHETPETAAWLEDVAEDGKEPVGVRERALRLLGEMEEVESLRDAYRSLSHVALKERAMRLVHEAEGAGSADWLRRIAEDRSEAIGLRERAVRLLGELRQLEYLQQVYPSLEHRGLRERVLRIVGERRDAAAIDWIEEIAEDTGETSGIRERAVRVLAERGVESERLARLYDRVDSRTVRRRLIRVFGDRADEASIEKLEEIMRDDPSTGLRREAARAYTPR